MAVDVKRRLTRSRGSTDREIAIQISRGRSMRDPNHDTTKVNRRSKRRVEERRCFLSFPIDDVLHVDRRFYRCEPLSRTSCTYEDTKRHTYSLTHTHTYANTDTRPTLISTGNRNLAVESPRDLGFAFSRWAERCVARRRNPADSGLASRCRR